MQARLLAGPFLPVQDIVHGDGQHLAKTDPATAWRHLALIPQDYTR